MQHNFVIVKERMVQDRLFFLVSVSRTTGKSLFRILKERFFLKSLNITDCSSDNAANIVRSHNRVQAHIKSKSYCSEYTCCYAPVLKVVLQPPPPISCKPLITLWRLLNVSDTHMPSNPVVSCRILSEFCP